MILVDPADIREDWLHLPPAEFKSTALYWAGENFKTNSRIVGRKSRVATLMSLLLFVEAALFIVWLART